MRMRIFGDILNKAKLVNAKNILMLRNAVIHTLYVWVDNKDTEIVVEVDGQRISFTASKVYGMSLRSYDMGMIPQGIPVVVYYDDANNVYVLAFRLDKRVNNFSFSIVPPSGETIEYAYQMLMEVAE